MCNQKQHPSTSLACVTCGESDPTKLEFHMIGDVRVILCRKCYRQLIDLTRAQLKPIWDPPDELETIARALLAEADLLVMLAQARWKFAHLLLGRVHREAPAEPTSQG